VATPSEVKTVAKILDPSLSDESKDMALEIIDAIDAIRAKRDQWIVIARLSNESPVFAAGAWTTKNQALKRVSKLSLVNKEGDQSKTGVMVARMMQPEWIESLQD
jgi:hypothetical protein